MPIDQNFRDVAYPQETVEAFVFLLSISHDILPEFIRLTNSEYDLQFVLDDDTTVTFIAAPFELQPPGEIEDDPRGRLIIPNVDQRIGAAIDQISTPPSVRIRQVLESDTSIVFADYRGLKLQEIRGTAESFEGMLGWDPFSTEPWPMDIIGPNKFRAVFRVL
jgi:hypothetical protein